MWELKKVNEIMWVNGVVWKGKIEEMVNVGILLIIYFIFELKYVGGVGLNNIWMGVFVSVVLVIEKER